MIKQNEDTTQHGTTWSENVNNPVNLNYLQRNDKHKVNIVNLQRIWYFIIHITVKEKEKNKTDLFPITVFRVMSQKFNFYHLMIIPL